MTYDEDGCNYFDDDVDVVGIPLANKWRPRMYLVEKGQLLITLLPHSCMAAHQSAWLRY